MALFEPAGLSPAFVLPAAFVSPQPVGILRWATAGYLSGTDDDPANTLWEPRLLDDVRISQSAVDAIGIGGLLPVGLADIGLADADGALADLDRWSTADGRRASITAIPVEDARASDVGTPLAGRAHGMRLSFLTGLAEIARTDPVPVFVGITSRVDRDGRRNAMLRLVDVVEQLAVPLQPNKYLGTGGLEGGEELEDKPKPVLLGFGENVEPIALGDIDLGVGIGPLATYQFHWRAASEVVAVRIRGVVQTLVGGTPTVGQARAFADQGLVQLGGTADGSVRVDARGDAVGGYVSSTPGVLRRLAQSLGPQLGSNDFDDVSFAFAENDLGGEIGWYQGAEETTASQAAERIVGGCGAILCGARRGLLRLVDPLASDIDQFTLGHYDIIACDPLEMPAALKPLPRAVGIGFRPNWSPLDDAAGVVTAADRQRFRNDQSGPARATSPTITKLVAQQRDLLFAGLYASRVDALARAQTWRAFLAAGPRLFQVTTDRYLHVIETGHIGRIAYPAWGLDAGARVSVLGWDEWVAARRLTLTVVTLPEV